LTASFRLSTVELEVESPFTGEELVRRMKEWVTADPLQVIEVVNRYGRLKVLDDTDLFTEVENVEDFQNLQKALRETFGAEVDLEKIVRK